jgi:hypothetical protein
MIRIILIGLVILLIITLVISYKKTKEGFESFFNELGEASENIISDIGSGITNIGKDIENSVTSTPSILTPSPTSGPVTTSVPQPPMLNQIQQAQSEIVVSGPGFDAMTLQQKTQLLRDVQKLVRNEVIVDRMMDNSINNPMLNQIQESNALNQGKEYSNECKKNCEGPCPRNKDGSCPPVPDMSEYIRKDQIPCWNCTLDY